EKALGVAGVMGGEDSGISENTVDILIESANFDAVSVRQSSIKLGIRTDSVQRFEKSLDPAQCEIALKRAVELILELCPGATVDGPITDIANFDDSEKLVALDVARVKNKIGMDLKVEEMADHLKALGFGIQGKVSETHQTLLVQIPSYRATKDVNIEDDLVEEIARIYGYENLPAILPVLPSRVPKPNTARRQKHQARTLLAGLGLTESMNYSFYSKAVLARYELDEHKHVKLLNALSEEQSHLRSTLVPNLLKSLREAVKTDPDAGLFEMGRVFEKTKDFMPTEEKRLAFALHFTNKDLPFFAAKGLLESFCEVFGVSGLQVNHKENPLSYMHPAQSADLELRGKVIGTLFTVHPALAALEDFVGRLAVCELN
ncbi:MAG: phenylalanine--tRNA ligase beta subunit-related protein, partial [Patescibacteria group bacterium]